MVVAFGLIAGTSWRRVLSFAWILVAAPGCAGVWDEMLSHERDIAYITGIGKPNPLIVIRDNADGVANADGTRRAQALSQLREPLQSGGNAQDQEAYLDILGAAARDDHEPLCRLASIRALGRFRDPRAARLLEEVYQQRMTSTSQENARLIRFTPEINAVIRKEALVALESTKDAEARHLLIRVARQPGPPINADLTDRQQTQDEKVVAIRALRHYRQQECVDALVHIMKTEKDIALRNCALASLEEVTGKKWPLQREAWQRDDVRPEPALASDYNPIQRVGAWFQKK